MSFKATKRPVNFLTKTIFLVLFITLLTSCRSLGPAEISGTHALYNQAIVTSLSNQLLQNLVRLRYRDNPYFLGITNVTASLAVRASVGTNTELDLGPGGNLIMPNASVGYSSGPTISYTPLQGEDFLRSILSPISIESLFVLINSGWSVNRVFGIAIERINNIENAPSASGPTPLYSPPNQENFIQFLDLLEKKRVEGVIRSRIDKDSGELSLSFENVNDDAEIDDLKTLLTLDPQQEVFTVDGDFSQIGNDNIAIRTRSIMSILFYLSHNTEIPESDISRGLVTQTRESSGEAFDWSQTAAGSQFKVHSSNDRPDTASLAVQYRDHWFYINDSDIESKSSFLLLSQLFSLQAGAISQPGPTLTIPVSR